VVGSHASFGTGLIRGVAARLLARVRDRRRP